MNTDKIATVIGAAQAATIGSTIDLEKLVNRDKVEIAKAAYIGFTLLFGWITNRRNHNNGATENGRDPRKGN